jgi:hypothetical protein
VFQDDVEGNDWRIGKRDQTCDRLKRGKDTLTE